MELIHRILSQNNVCVLHEIQIKWIKINVHFTLRYTDRIIENMCSNRNLCRAVHTALVTRAKRRKQAKCPSNDEQILDSIILSEVTQTEKLKYHMVSLVGRI